MVKTASSSLMAKLAIAMAALAVMFCMAAMPAQAFAAAGSSSEPDNVIAVNGTTVDLDDVYNNLTSAQLADHPTLGGLFVQQGAVKVVKADKYVKLSEIIAYANANGANITWASGKTMAFDVWNTEKVVDPDTLETITVWKSVPEQYTKNNTFTYDNLMSTCTTFYNADSSAIDTTSALQTGREAVIALESETYTIGTGYTASAILASSAFPTVGYTAGADAGTYASPRLVWGYNPNVTSQAGNRFPSNIDAITIS